MKLIGHYLKKHIWIFLLSTMFLTLEAVADLLQPTFMSFIVDRGVLRSDLRQILLCGAVMLLIAVAGAFSAIMRNRFSSRTSQAIGREMRQDMYHNIQQLSLENIDRLRPASLITRITNDVSQIQEFINSIMRMMVKAPITCVGAIVLILIQTPKQAPVMIGIVLVVALLILGNMKVGYPRFGTVQKKLDSLNGVTREFLSAIRVVKAFSAEDEEAAKFASASEALARANVAALRTAAVFSPLISLTVNFGIVLLLWISRNQNAAEIGKLMASVNYMTQVLFSVNMISHVINVAVRAMASAGRIQEVLEEKPAQKQPDKPLRPQFHGEITFENVSFSYAGAGKEALRNLSFTIHPGETVGVIGPTGSGKTTLANLIPRLYDATGGRILIDGWDVTQIDAEALRSAVAIAAQKPLLFTGSIRENLLWGKETATEEEVLRSARTACADEFIRKTENGYDTWLGQGGVNLSGGQKQRLCLARALLREPRILILDDCTSALDAHTEAEVLRRLKEATVRRTVLLISQRISTVMRTDRILCLDNGRVEGFGTHAELMERCPLYRTIYASQIGGEPDGR